MGPWFDANHEIEHALPRGDVTPITRTAVEDASAFVRAIPSRTSGGRANAPRD